MSKKTEKTITIPRETRRPAQTSNRNALLQRVANLTNELDLTLLKAALDVIEDPRDGVFAPTTEAVQSILQHYAWGRLNAEQFQEILDAFRTNVDNMAEVAADFLKTYPDRAKTLCAEVLKNTSAA